MTDHFFPPDESNFALAEQFIPDRWTSQPELIKNKDAFAPFSIGPYGCIGKNLAYMEIRLLTTNIIRQFDVKLAEGETGEKLLMGTKDHVSSTALRVPCPCGSATR